MGAAASPCRPPYPSPVPQRLRELATGTVKPTGWLRDWSLSFWKGMLGSLDKPGHILHADNNGTWEDDPRGGNLIDDKDFWPYEISGQWLEALVRMGYALDNRAIQARATSQVNAILARQDSDGYLGWTEPPGTRGPSAKERWASGGDVHWALCPMLRALLAYASATGDTRIVPALERHYQPFRFTLGQLTAKNKTSEPRVFANIEVMFAVYAWGGNRMVLQNALHTSRLLRVDKQWNQIDSDSALRSDYIPEGHGDRFVELVKLHAIASVWLSDPDYLRVSTQALNRLQELCVLPHGLPEAAEFIEPGIRPGARTEMTTASNYLYSLLKMAAITGNGTYADRAEKAFYNGCAGNISADCRRTPYYAVADRTVIHPFTLNSNHGGQEWTEWSWTGHNQVNACRILPSFLSFMWMATSDNGLAAVLYGPCRLVGKVATGVDIAIRESTVYPLSGDVTILIENLAHPTSFALHVRVSQWCSNFEVAVNGGAVAAAGPFRGFAVLKRAWRQGDCVELRFPQGTRAKQHIGLKHNLATVKRGPLTFAVAHEHRDENTPAADIQATAAQVTNARDIERSVVLQAQIAHPFSWHQYPPPVHMECTNGFGVRTDSGQIVPATQTLVPMACAPVRTVFVFYGSL